MWLCTPCVAARSVDDERRISLYVHLDLSSDEERGHSSLFCCRRLIGRMPSNHNFVCFDCRVNVRRFKLAEAAPLCPQCGRECTNLGYKIPIPSKDDQVAWERLYVDIREGKRRLLMTQEENRVALTHQLERQLEGLKSQPTNPGRERAIATWKSV
jgi:hypothetical protein